MDDPVLDNEEELEIPGGKIEDTDITTEMKDSFLDYSMSVIVSRALPDVRDGMKPVHRRILYSMASLNMGPNVAHKKSARIVGDVIAKYHPHGDTAVYDAMVRMAQDFSYRYPLVDGHGNFGSLDGDGAAAMRYTEARMSKISTEMVADLNKETVNLVETYDGDGTEPEILPSRVPNLLLNGSTGIAVGMATNIPTHNLNESVKAIKALIENPEMTTPELMEYIPGPDFPTGGIIMGRNGIKRAYETGRGNIPVRSRYRIEEFENGRKRIVFYEIPYQVNKLNLMEKIANTIKAGQIQGVSRLNDESNREGIRIVVELKKGTQEEVVLNQLFRLTPLQSNYSVNMLALQNGRPKQLSLKEIIQSYIDHQCEVIERRTQFNLKKAKERLHIVEGLRIALDHLDELINMIRSSHGPEDELIARMNERFGLDDIQSKAILSMQIRRLSGLERQKIEDEYNELMAQIADYEDILANHDRVLKIITDDLDEMAEKYGDERRTQIGADIGETLDEDLIPTQDIIVTLTDSGYLKSQALENYHAQNRGGKGIRSTNLFEEDSIDRLVYMNNHDHLLLFTNQGRVYRLRGFDIPVSSRQAKGSSVINFVPLREGEKVKALLPYYKDPEKRKRFKYLFFATENGLIKRTPIEEFKNILKSGKKAITLNEGDSVAFIKPTTGEDEIFIASSEGKVVHFNEEDIRPISRNGTGVRGILLRSGKVVGLELRREGDQLVLLSENGIGKRVDIDSINRTHRGVMGTITFKVNENNGKLVGFRALQGDEDALVLTKNGIMIRVKASDFRQLSRHASGTKIIRLDPDDQVARMVLAPANSLEEVIEEDILTGNSDENSEDRPDQNSDLSENHVNDSTDEVSEPESE